MSIPMSDEELDRDWKPSGRRPQSTIARSFSAELMDIFRIENSVSDLDHKVDERKKVVDKSTNELASLEARLKEMEERLRQSQGRPISTVTQQQQQHTATTTTSDDMTKARSRPGTAKASQPALSSGNMPPTPGASEGEYYLVTEDDLHDGPR